MIDVKRYFLRDILIIPSFADKFSYVAFPEIKPAD